MQPTYFTARSILTDSKCHTYFQQVAYLQTANSMFSPDILDGLSHGFGERVEGIAEGCQLALYLYEGLG